MTMPHLSRRDWLKAAAVGAIGSMSSAFIPTRLFADHGGFRRPGLEFTFDDVRIGLGHKGQTLIFHPRTGAVTTQSERRALFEVRTHIGVWRAIRKVQEMMAASPADLREQIDRAYKRAVKGGFSAMHWHHRRSRNALRTANKTYLLHAPGGVVYPWRFAGGALKAVRDAVGLNLPWAEKNFEPELLTLLGISINKGKVTALPPPPAPKGHRADDVGRLGALHPQMTFKPLTDQMRDLLDAVQRSHDAWVQGIKDNASSRELDDMVNGHHREHMQLEFLARDHDELTLLAFAHHMHDIDPRHPRSKIIALADQSNTFHRNWVDAVKQRNVRVAWNSGLRHSAVHIMLGLAGIEQEIVED